MITLFPRIHRHAVIYETILNNRPKTSNLGQFGHNFLTGSSVKNIRIWCFGLMAIYETHLLLVLFVLFIIAYKETLKPEMIIIAHIRLLMNIEFKIV